MTSPPLLFDRALHRLRLDRAAAGFGAAEFLKAREATIRAALSGNDLKRARELVNGGAHGLERFSDCYRRGEALLHG